MGRKDSSADQSQLTIRPFLPLLFRVLPRTGIEAIFTILDDLAWIMAPLDQQLKIQLYPELDLSVRIGGDFLTHNFGILSYRVSIQHARGKKGKDREVRL